jgi:hypothetical protein
VSPFLVDQRHRTLAVTRDLQEAIAEGDMIALMPACDAAEASGGAVAAELRTEAKRMSLEYEKLRSAPQCASLVVARKQNSKQNKRLNTAK